MTNRNGLNRGLFGLAALASLSFAACDRPVETRIENVRDYIRNAHVGAAVRRLEPPAQAYVDQVLSAYETYRDAFDPIERLASEEALWPLNDSRWRNAADVEERHELIEAWLADTPDADDPDDKTRPELRAELEQAIESVPTLPETTAAREAELISFVTSTLDAGSIEPEHEKIARLYRTLTKMAIDHVEAFIPGASGLVFKNESLTARAASTWTELHDLIVPYYTPEDLAEAEAEVEELRESRAEALERKQALRGQISKSRETLREYRELELLVQYYDAIVRQGESEIKEIEKALSAEKARPH